MVGNRRDYRLGSLKSFSFIKQSSRGAVLDWSQLFVHVHSHERDGMYTAHGHCCFLSILGCFGGPVIAERVKRPCCAVKQPATLLQISALLREPNPMPDTPVGTHCTVPAGLREVAEHPVARTSTAWRHI